MAIARAHVTAQKRRIEHTDRKVAHATGGQRDTLTVKAMGMLSELADQPPLISLSGVTIVVGLVMDKERIFRTGVRMLASHWLATKGKSFVKHRIDRTRPSVILGGGSYHAKRGHSHAKQENSFPFGHTSGAVAVARAIARDFPAAAPVAYTVAAAAGLVQLPRGTHYASDVLVGAAIGWVAELAVRLVLPKAADPIRPNQLHAAPIEIVPVAMPRIAIYTPETSRPKFSPL